MVSDFIGQLIEKQLQSSRSSLLYSLHTPLYVTIGLGPHKCHFAMLKSFFLDIFAILSFSTVKGGPLSDLKSPSIPNG